MRRIFAALLAAASCTPPQASSSVPFDQLVGRQALRTQLDSIARAWLKDAPAAGATVAVIMGRDTILLEGIGERDRETHLPAERNTVYKVGSITKQFTAAAVMRLVEQGKIALSDPMTKYLPEYPQWSSVTIEQLLNHTSGIHSYTSVPSWQKTWGDELPPAQIVAFVAKDTFDFAPGTKWSYNNTGYVLLGMVLDRVTGKPYPQLMQDWFFKPLKMRSATYCPNKPTGPEYATGYDLRGGTVVPTFFLSMSHPYSAGALCMSVPDYLTWQTALTSGKVVKPETFARMITPTTVTHGYGFALFADTLRGHRMIQHGGDIPGFSAQQLWLPDDSVRVVVFANTLASDPGFLAENLAAGAIGVPLKQKNKLVAVALQSADKYVGTYDIALPNGQTLSLTIAQGPDGLTAEAPGQGKIPLTYLGNDTFGASFDPTMRLTIQGTKAKLVQRGVTMEGVKRP